MIVHDVEQTSPEWWACRLGLPTASCFDRILTPATLKPSKQAEAYMNKLLAEWLTGGPVDEYSNAAMERGTEMEPEAWRAYEFYREVDVIRGGFCTLDNGLAGCSPDGRIYEGEKLLTGIELKCPNAATHVAYLRQPSALVAAYRHQVQGCMYVCEVAWWDLMSYHPLMPPVIERVERDEAHQTALAEVLGQFVHDLQREKQALLERGFNPMDKAA
jgi:hypothetical protein